MKRLGFTILGLIALAPQFALAGNFTVPINAARKIAFYYSINEDCSSLGETVVRITSQPRHGNASVKLGRDHPNFNQSNPRNACNTRQVPSTQVWYKPERNYVGPDSATLDVIFPHGTTRQDTITIDVR